MRTGLTVLLLLVSSEGFSQNTDENKLQDHQTAEQKIEYYLQYARDLSLKKNGNFLAKQYADSALELALEIGSKHAEMLYWNTAGIIARESGYYHDALEYHNRSLSLSKSLNETEQRPFIYNNIAYIMRHSGNHSEAVKLLLKGLELAQENKDSYAQAFLLNGLAASYLMLNDYSKALEYFNLALVAANRNDNKRSKAINYAGIGQVYYKRKQYEEAENYYSRCLEINRELSDSKGIHIALEGLGDIAYAQDQTQKALRFYFEAYEQAENNNKNKNLQAELALKLAGVYIHEKLSAEAEKFIKIALDLGNELKNNELKSKAYELTAETDAMRGHYKRAYENRLIYAAYKDSLTSSEIEKSMLSAQLKYELERSREQIDLLEKRNIAQQQRERLKLISLGIAAVLLIIVIVAVFLLRMVKQRGKVNKNLKNALRKNEMLLSEIHHRIKNNFAVVIGLLRLQKKDIDKKPGVLAIEDTINRIYTYAAVHEQAYGLKDYGKIDIGNFIKNQAIRIREQYSRPLVEIVPQLQTVYPDLSTAVSMALYSNEILNNAFQHGFSENDSGIVKIELKMKAHVLQLKISNSGKKPDKSFNINNVDSAGLHIAKLYAMQLKGHFNFERDSNTFFLEFKFSKTAAGPWETKRNRSL